jgi:predicted house-cleaning noncanonical NTP pyrophosphatase (MazG superfamily)
MGEIKIKQFIEYTEKLLDTTLSEECKEGINQNSEEDLEMFLSILQYKDEDNE